MEYGICALLSSTVGRGSKLLTVYLSFALGKYFLGVYSFPTRRAIACVIGSVFWMQKVVILKVSPPRKEFPCVVKSLSHTACWLYSLLSVFWLFPLRGLKAVSRL